MRGGKSAAGLRCPNSVLGGFPVPWERPEAEERPAVSCLDRRQHPRCRSRRPLHRRLSDVRHAARQPGGQRDRRPGDAGQVSARRRRRPQMVLQRAAAAAQPGQGRPRMAAHVPLRRAAQCRRHGLPPGRRVQGVELGLRRRPLQAQLPAPRAGHALSLRSARRRGQAALPLHARRHAAHLAGDQPDGLARRPDRGAARAQDHPHRVRRLLDHRRPAAPALLLSRAGRLLAEPLGRVEEARPCTSRC